MPFSGYASRRIHGAVLDATRSIDWASRGLRRDMRAMDRAAANIEQATGTTATDEELADATGLDLATITRRRREVRTVQVLPLDRRPAHDPEAPSLAASIAESRREASPDRALEQVELVGMLRTAVRHLPEATREVLVRHYFDDELFRDIAADLGVTEARVSQLHAEGLNALRAHMAAEDHDVPAVAADAPGVRRRAAYVASMAAVSDLRTRLEAGHGLAVSGTA